MIRYGRNQALAYRVPAAVPLFGRCVWAHNEMLRASAVVRLALGGG